MSTGGRELVATDEPEVVSEALLDSIVVENGQSDRSFPDSTSADESDWTKVLSEANDLLD